MLHSVSADILIMGIMGVTKSGLSDSNSLIVESIRAMIHCARRVVIVADHSKFGRDAMIRVADLSDVDQVVTDNGLDQESQQMLKENGVEFVLT
jgi:DeoR family glycerol-3-phosphate regulon repressor